MKKVLILDTSVMCTWLQVPGKETCGKDGNILTHDIVERKIETGKSYGTTFILPIASIIETGNHIAHSSGDRHKIGEEFSNLICDTADNNSPWAAFTEQSVLWQPEKLKALAERWKETVVSGQSLGDASIVEVADYYAKMGFNVEIFTGDEGLKAYEPLQKTQMPRRRKKTIICRR